MKLSINYKRQYKKVSNGNARTVFVYGVNGTAEDLASYKTVQGSNYRDDKDGSPLWFTTSFVGDNGALAQSSNGKLYADMSHFDKAQSMCAQFEGTAFGDAIAKQMVASLLGATPSAVPPTEQPKPIEATDGTQDLKDL